MDTPPELARFAQWLRGQQFKTELNGDRLTVITPGGELAVVVRCDPRPEDGGRRWFFDDAYPLAEADQIVNAAMALKGRFAP